MLLYKYGSFGCSGCLSNMEFMGGALMVSAIIFFSIYFIFV